MKWIKYFIVILILSLIFWTLYSIDQRVLIEGSAFDITENELQKAKNDNSNSTDQQILALLFEERFNDQLLQNFNIDSSDEAKMIYFKKYHPKTISEERFNSIKNHNIGLLNALESLRDKKLSIDEAYDKYLLNYTSKEVWLSISKTSDKHEVIFFLKKDVMKTFADFSKEALDSLKSKYVKGAISKKICELDEVNSKLDKYTANFNKQIFRSPDHNDSVIKNLRRTRCEEESKSWLKSYFEKNYQLQDEKYSGFDKYLGFSQM